ncbi:MAG: cytochrome P450 [Mycobacterium sp.]
MTPQRIAFASTTRWEGLRFTVEVALPNAGQGLFRRQPRRVRIVACTGVEERGRALLARLRGRYGDGPVWIRGARTATLVVFGDDPIRFALSSSPDPFAADPDPKRSGMLLFQPDALTISRGPLWTQRRRFTDSVLGRADGDATLREKFLAIAREEAQELLGEVDFEAFNLVLHRMARRIILGETAADDDQVSAQLSRLMEKANPPGRGDPATYQRFVATLTRYVERAEPASLVGLFGDAPVSGGTDPVGQLPHWMFAMADSVATNVWRCLALLASHPTALQRARDDLVAQAAPSTDFVAACLQESMRLWPTTAILSRITTRPVRWAGADVPAGTQVYIVNSFNHRDSTRLPFADRFDPDVWLDGNLANSWAINHFSKGPQACPGAGLATALGTAIVAAIVERTAPALKGVDLDRDQPLPYTLNPFAVRLSLRPW